MMFADKMLILNEMIKEAEENHERWRYALERRGI